ncbi:uncharacterized protein LOC120291789 [Eucalyptus grandis]|uniref:uncharacterized protein LOC120291789 n=1 Tax=Eucalyptus grandis TaxID=71139 RepID=UPI00192F111A|nr:uncharacterized protein LOC120291789 [Eucalyptus grandis]
MAAAAAAQSWTALQPVNFSEFKFDVPILNGENYKVWKESILLQLGWMDIDYVIRKDKPPAPIDSSTAAEITLYNQWERNAKALLEAIDTQFESSEKAHAMTLIMKFSSMKLTSVKGVREYIMQMRDIAAQLKNLKVEISEYFLMYYILNTLP